MRSARRCSLSQTRAETAARQDLVALKLDKQRAHRRMAVWTTGDRLAAHVVLEEAMADPIGTPGLLFTLVEGTCRTCRVRAAVGAPM